MPTGCTGDMQSQHAKAYGVSVLVCSVGQRRHSALSAFPTVLSIIMLYWGERVCVLPPRLTSAPQNPYPSPQACTFSPRQSAAPPSPGPFSLNRLSMCPTSRCWYLTRNPVAAHILGHGTWQRPPHLPPGWSATFSRAGVGFAQIWIPTLSSEAC